MGFRRTLPGVVALAGGAVVARAAGRVVGVDPLLAGVALGALLVNAAGVPAWLRPGVGTHDLWLGAGIVLMGASVTLDAVADAGGVVLAVVVVVTTTTVLTVELLSRALGLGDRLGSLLAAGAGICGVSAVVAVAGAVRARETQVAYAAATVLLFDAVTLVVYPIVGDALGLSGTAFGVWAGASMFSTGPVVAAGFAHSDVAGRWATVTKLSRNALIGVVVLGYGSYYARADGPERGVAGAAAADATVTGGAEPSNDESGVDTVGASDTATPDDATVGGGALVSSLRTVWTEFPKFVVGFLAMVALAGAGLFSPAQVATLERAYSWLFLLAFVGLGTEIQVGELRETGVRPALVVLAALLVAAALSLAAVTVLV